MRSIENTIKNWKKEAMLTDSPIAYNINFDTGEITIYTIRPGWLVGKAGKLINNYENKMKKVWPLFKGFKLVEVWNVL